MDQNSVVRHSRTTTAEGKPYDLVHYNLKAALAVDFRVKPPRRPQLRRWANTQSREFIALSSVDRMLTANDQPLLKDLATPPP